jgi:ATPase family AAA domain-containing protein 1
MRSKSQNLWLLVIMFTASRVESGKSHSWSSMAALRMRWIRHFLSISSDTSSCNNEFHRRSRRRRRRGPWNHSRMMDTGELLLAKGSDSFCSPVAIDLGHDNRSLDHNHRPNIFMENNIKSIEIFPLVAWKTLSSFAREVAQKLTTMVSSVKSNRLLDRLSTGAKFAVFAVIGVELFLIVRDIYCETINEYRDAMADDDQSNLFHGFLKGNGANAVLSPANVRQLILWLQEPNKEARPLPPNDVSPTWMIPLAEELRECKALSLSDIQQILSRLSKAEAAILQTCILPSENKLDFQDIGGLVVVKATIAQWMSSSLSFPEESIASSLGSDTSDGEEISPFQKFVSKNIEPRSLGLWGPPGCGKSLLIRAIAKHSGLPTLVITPSLLQRKWYGESTARVRTLFKLIDTLGLCLVVMDEMDGLFMSRRDEDIEVTRELKTEWLQWWDGLARKTLSAPSTSPSFQHRRVLFVAATNRPWDVDAAAWRRLGHRLYVGLPNASDRYDLMRKWMRDLPPVHPQVLTFVVQATEGYTPSDLHNVLIWACQNGPIARKDANLELEDMGKALQVVDPTRFSTQYVSQVQGFLSSHHHGTDSTLTPVPSGYEKFSTQIQGEANDSVVTGFPSPGMPNRDGLLWETPMGNFYQLQVPVDPSVFDAIQNFFLNDQSDQEDFFWSDLEDDDNLDEDADSEDY